jgi:hypothetical protein
MTGVEAEGSTGMRHACHWPECEKKVPPKLLMCARHWKTLPQSIRSAIWATYRDGQEIDKNPSREYVAAARAAQEWARERERERERELKAEARA